MKHSVGLFSVLIFTLTIVIFPFIGASAQDLSTIIFSLAWSPDGSKIAIGKSGKIEILDAADLTPITTLMGSSGAVSAVDWSPDGSKLAGASFGSNGLAVWDISTGQIISAQSIDSVAVKWHPDNISVAAADTSINIGLWNTSTGEDTLLFLQGSTIDWSPDGSKLVSAIYNEAELTVTDITTGETLFTVSGDPYGVGDVDWSPDGTKIASGGPDNTIKVWNAATGESLLTLEGHTDLISSVAWSPNNQNLASGSSDGTVRFWNSETGESLGVTEAIGQVRAISWSPNGSQLVYGGDDGIVQIISAPQLQAPTPSDDSQGIGSIIFSLAWSPDGSKIAVGKYGRIEILDAANQTILNTLTGSDGAVSMVDWSPDGDKLAVANGAKIDIWQQPWSSTASQLIDSFQQNGDYFNSVSWNAVGTRIASSRGSFIDVWDVSTQTNLYTLTHEGEVFEVEWSHSGTLLASVSLNAELRIWDGITGELLNNVLIYSALPYPEDRVSISTLSWSPDDSQIMVGAENGTIHIWERVNSEPVSTPSRSLTGHTDNILSVEWSSDGNRVASGSWDGTVRIWNAETGQQLQVIQASAPVYAVVWSPDGTHLAYSDGDTVQIIPASATMQSEAQVLRELLSYPTCKRTCFMGIEPGVTTQEQVKDYFNSQGIFYEIFILPSGGEANGIYYWFLDSSLPFPRAANFQSWITFENGIVSSIQLVRAVPLSTVIEAYGSPQYVLGNTIDQNYDLAYPQIGLAFFINADYANDQTSRISISTSAYYQDAIGYEAPVQNCTNVPATICTIATATPTP